MVLGREGPEIERFAGPPGPADTASDPWGLEEELLFDKLRSPL